MFHQLVGRRDILARRRKWKDGGRCGFSWFLFTKSAKSLISRGDKRYSARIADWSCTGGEKSLPLHEVVSHKVHCFTLPYIVSQGTLLYIVLHCLTRYIALHCLTLSYKVHCFTSAFSLTHDIYLRRPSWPWFIATFSGNLYWI